jgi:hypothetical protein
LIQAHAAAKCATTTMTDHGGHALVNDLSVDVIFGRTV